MSNSIVTSIGENIRQLREENGISRINLATELGYSTAQYGKIERGEQKLDCHGLIALCRFVHCRPEQIVFGEREEEESVPDYFSGYSETQKRRIFRSLYILLGCHQMQASQSFHKMFGTDLLREIPESEKNIIPLVLEYERKSRDLTRRGMIEFLEISKNKYYSLLDGEELSSIHSLIKLTQKLGYDMTFLLVNKVRPELFLSEINHLWDETEQGIFRKQLDLCVSMGELSQKMIERQNRRRQGELDFLKQGEEKKK